MIGFVLIFGDLLASDEGRRGFLETKYVSLFDIHIHVTVISSPIYISPIALFF